MIINKPADKKPIEWEYNDRSYKEYVGKGLTPPDNLLWQERKFIQLTDPTKCKPVRTVTKIVRLKAPDWEDKHHAMKEYVYWYEDWREAKDHLGRPIFPITSSVFGRYGEITLMDVFDRYGEIIGQKMSGKREKYYVPFSKKTVDDIIARSDNTDKDNGINFTFKGPTFRNDQFSYEQFVNSDYNLMIEMMSIKGGPRMFNYYQQFDVKERQEKFKKYAQVT